MPWQRHMRSPTCEQAIHDLPRLLHAHWSPNTAISPRKWLCLSTRQGLIEQSAKSISQATHETLIEDLGNACKTVDKDEESGFA